MQCLPRIRNDLRRSPTTYADFQPFSMICHIEYFHLSHHLFIIPFKVYAFCSLSFRACPKLQVMGDKAGKTLAEVMLASLTLDADSQMGDETGKVMAEAIKHSPSLHALTFRAFRDQRERRDRQSHVRSHQVQLFAPRIHLAINY